MTREMIRLAAVAAATAVATAAVGSGTADGRPARLCESRTGKTLAASDQVRVLQPRQGPVLACLRGKREVRTLRGAEPSYFRPVTAGRFAAYEILGNGREGASSSVYVIDVRSGRVVVNAESYFAANATTEVSGDARIPAEAFLLERSGAATWMAPRPDGVVEISTSAPRTGSVATVDAAADIELDSLAVNSRFVYWQKRGASYSYARP